MKKVLLWVFIFVAALVFSSFWLTLEGLWLDKAVSVWTSHRFHVRAKLNRVRVVHWTQAHFDSLDVASEAGNRLVSTGAGEIRFLRIPVLKQRDFVSEFQLEKVVLFADFYKIFLTTPFPIPQYVQEASVVDRLRFRLAHRNHQTDIRILQCDSSEIFAAGGIRLEGKQMKKLHLALFVSEGLSRRLPKLLRQRLIQMRGSWVGAHILFCKNVITLVGQNGPFFKAQWHVS